MDWSASQMPRIWPSIHRRTAFCVSEPMMQAASCAAKSVRLGIFMYRPSFMSEQ